MQIRMLRCKECETLSSSKVGLTEEQIARFETEHAHGGIEAVQFDPHKGRVVAALSEIRRAG